MENFKSYKKKIDEVKGGESTGYRDYTYEDALMEVKKYIQEKKIRNMDVGIDAEHMTKEFFERRKERFREYIKDAVTTLRIRVDDYTDKRFITESLSDIAGFSVLDSAFEDPRVTDIFVNDWNDIHVDLDDGVGMRYPYTFRSEQHYRETIERFLKEAGKEINGGDKKIVHFSLYGNRGCAVHDTVATKLPSITFRKHSSSVKRITREDLLKGEVLTEDMADLIGCMLKGELSLAYAGVTGSGKTTTLEALINAYLTEKRVLTCEDVQELKLLDVRNVLGLVSFNGKTEEESVTLEDLVYTSLRQKPRVLAIGEIRTGPQMLAAVEAAETGHSTIYTIHGNEAISVINRIVTKYLVGMPSIGVEVAERIIGNALDYICIQDAIPGIGRKVTSITEVSYDDEKRTVRLKTIYEYDVERDEFIKVNPISESKIKNMYRRGVRPEEVVRWKY